MQIRTCLILAITVFILSGHCNSASSYADESSPRYEEASRENLEVLGRALALYMATNDGKPPTRLSVLYEKRLVLDLDTFACPGSGTRITSPKEIDQRSDYLLTATSSASGPRMLIREKKGFHGGKALALYSDYRVRKEAPGLSSTSSQLDEFPGEWEVDDPALSYRLRLRQEGGRITGSFGSGGVLTAEVRRGKLQATWSNSELRRGGAALLTLSPDRKLLTGSWQYDPKVFSSGLTGDGTWRFRRVAGKATAPPISSTVTKVTVPGVLGLSAKDAKASLAAAGLAAQFILGEKTDAPNKAYFVYKQFPSSGALVLRGETIQLTVYAPGGVP